MPSNVESKPAPALGIALPAYWRAIIFGIAWLPVLYLLAIQFPENSALYDRLRKSGEMPMMTDWWAHFARANEPLLFFPCLLFFAFLIAVDVGAATLLVGSRRRWMYWLWFAGVITASTVTTAMVTIALLMPVIRMSSTI